MTPTTTKTRIITLTDAPPVQIVEDDWPVIAEAKWYEGEHEHQANRTASVRVREHTDGRCIVYGVSSSHWAKERGRSAGVLLDADTDVSETRTIAAIHEVTAAIGYEDQLAAECIADLPPVEL